MRRRRWRRALPRRPETWAAEHRSPTIYQIRAGRGRQAEKAQRGG
jgi:hypothetical protein